MIAPTRPQTSRSVTEFMARNYREGHLSGLTVELTRRCNLTCAHCFSIRERGKTEMNTEEIKGVLDQFKEMHGYTVLLTGGEVTIHRDFLDIVARARENRFLVTFYTNAMAVTPGMARELQRLAIEKVGISLYGADAETHDKMTGHPGSFDETIRGARYLVEAGLHTYFKILLTQFNHHEMPMMMALAEEVGAEFRHCLNLYPRNNRDTSPTFLRMDPGAEQSYWHDYFPELVDTDELACHDPTKTAALIRCPIGKTTITVNAYGEVLPCVVLPMVAGNIREKPLREIWERAPVFNMLRVHRDHPVEQCTTCTSSAYCERCPGKAYLETGTIFKRAPSDCQMADHRKYAAERRASEISEGKAAPVAAGRSTESYPI